MAFAYSVTLKDDFQKKPSQSKNAAPQPRTDSIAQFYYLCCVCIPNVKFYTPSDQKLCTFEIMYSSANSLTD